MQHAGGAVEAHAWSRDGGRAEDRDDPRQMLAVHTVALQTRPPTCRASGLAWQGARIRCGAWRIAPVGGSRHLPNWRLLARDQRTSVLVQAVSAGAKRAVSAGQCWCKPAGAADDRPSPTLSPTDPVPRGLLTLCPGLHIHTHTQIRVNWSGRTRRAAPGTLPTVRQAQEGGRERRAPEVVRQSDAESRLERWQHAHASEWRLEVDLSSVLPRERIGSCGSRDQS